MGRFLIIFLLAFVLTACDSHDSDFIPYDLEGYNVYVYVGEQEFYAGFVEANYINSSDKLSEAQSLAANFAYSKNFRKWDYIICTATSDSGCATRVR